MRILEFFYNLHARFSYAFGIFKEKKGEEVSRWTHFWCRFRGHPCGVVFYNPGGWEPDMSCKNCGEELG